MDVNWLKPQFSDLQHLTPLNSGGFKHVFSAVHSTDGDVVLKIIQPNQDVDSIQREFLAVQQVRSHRVPQILDIGQISTPLGVCFWFREQRIVGPTVRQCLQNGALDKVHLLKMGLHMLEALAQAEEVSIVHRDVKPENMICDTQGDFWLIDFGIARHLKLPSLTNSAAPFGKMTWGYAPPEQCRNMKSDIDSRADLFAMGVTLYECATGINPFRHNTNDALEMLRRVENRSLPPLSLSFPSASSFRDLIAAMTQKHRNQRPRSVKEAYEWMQEICKAEHI